MRLKAQQKLADRASSSATAAPPSLAAPAVGINHDSDQEELGSLTLSRGKRQAALKRPSTYSIDPTDDTSRLKRHPNMLPTSVAQGTASPNKKDIDRMLREQKRRMNRGTDADGLSRAEAIAQNMEQERLGKMGIACAADGDRSIHQPRDPGGSSRSGAHNPRRTLEAGHVAARSTRDTNGKESGLTVKVLSPTIPSFLWSSQSEADHSDDEMEVGAEHAGTSEEHRLAVTLAAMGANEDQSRQTLEILRRDMRDRTDVPPDEHYGHIPFYRPQKTPRPIVETFCEVPSDLSCAPTPSRSSTPAASTVEDDDWIPLVPYILLAGTIPPSLKLSQDQAGRLVLRIAVSYMLERDVLQSHLLSTFFQSLISDWSKSSYTRELSAGVPKALSDVVRMVPFMLNRLGASEGVLEECFPDHADATEGLFPIVERPRAGKRKKSRQLYLTQTERDDIIIKLARTLNMITSASTNPRFVVDHLSLLAGYVSSMAIACAATTNFALRDQLGCTFHSIFTGAAKARHGNVLRRMQEEVCWRSFAALGATSIAVRARLVAVWPGKGREIAAIRRWLAWCTLTDHLAPHSVTAKGGKEAVISSDLEEEAASEANRELEYAEGGEALCKRNKFEPLSVDLGMLMQAVNASDPRSPFYIAPVTGDTVGAEDLAYPTTRHTIPPLESRATSFETIVAATQLIALVLGDLPIHICRFSPATDRCTSTAARSEGSATPGRDDEAERAAWPRALRLALDPYLSLHPCLDQARLKAISEIIDRLATVNSKIRDNRGNVVLRSLAKDSLQRTCHSLEYQLHMYHPPSNMASFIT